MNDIPPYDSPLTSFEKQIAGQYPRLSTNERESLLYACAFSAGRIAGSRATAYWRIATAALSVTLIGALIPIERVRTDITEEQIQKAVPAQTPVPERSIEVAGDHPWVDAPDCKLDRWQIPMPAEDLLGEQLARLNDLDSHQRSLTIRYLTQAALNP